MNQTFLSGKKVYRPLYDWLGKVFTQQHQRPVFFQTEQKQFYKASGWVFHDVTYKPALPVLTEEDTTATVGMTTDIAGAWTIGT